MILVDVVNNIIKQDCYQFESKFNIKTVSIMLNQKFKYHLLMNIKELLYNMVQC